MIAGIKMQLRGSSGGNISKTLVRDGSVRDAHKTRGRRRLILVGCLIVLLLFCGSLVLLFDVGDAAPWDVGWFRNMVAQHNDSNSSGDLHPNKPSAERRDNETTSSGNDGQPKESTSANSSCGTAENNGNTGVPSQVTSDGSVKVADYRGSMSEFPVLAPWSAGERILSMAHDGISDLILTAGASNTISCWDVETGLVTREFQVKGDHNYAIMARPAHRQFSVGGNGRQVATFETNSGKCMATRNLDFALRVLSYNTQGSLLLAAGMAGQAVVLDAESLGSVSQVSIADADVLSGCIYADNAVFLGDSNGRLWQWLLKSRTLVRYEAHSKPVTACISFADRSTVITTSLDGFVKEWTWSAGTRCASSANAGIGSISAAGAMGNQGFVQLGSTDGQLRVYDVFAHTFMKPIASNIGRVAAIVDLYGKSGSIVGFESGSLSKYSLDNNRLVEPGSETIGHSSAISSIKVITSDKLLLTGDTAGKVIFWNLETHTSERVLVPHQGTVTTIQYDVDTQTAFFGYQDGVLCAWQRSSAAELFKIKAHRGRVADILIDTRRHRFWSCGADAFVKLWDWIPLDSPLVTHSLGFTARLLRLSPSAEAIFVLDGRDRITEWPAVAGERNRDVFESANAIKTFNCWEDSVTLYVANGSTQVLVLSVVGETECNARVLSTEGAAVSRLIASTQGDLVFGVATDSRCFVWGLNAGPVSVGKLSFGLPCCLDIAESANSITVAIPDGRKILIWNFSHR